MNKYDSVHDRQAYPGEYIVILLLIAKPTLKSTL